MKEWWLLHFHDNDEAIEAAGAFAKASVTFGKLMGAMAVNCYKSRQSDANPCLNRAQAAHEHFPQHFNIEKLPATFLYSAGSEPQRYNGEYTAKKLSDWAVDSLPYQGALVRNQESLTHFLIQNGGRPKLLLLTSKWAVPLMYKLLAEEIGPAALDVGVCRGESSGLPFLHRFEAVKAANGKLPILLFFENGDAKPLEYKGDLDKFDIKVWLSKQYGGRWTAVSEQSSLNGFVYGNPLIGAERQGPPTSRPKLLLVTTENDVPWMWRLLSILTDRIADVAISKVRNSNSRSEFIMRKFKLQTAPLILYFKGGHQQPTVYTGEWTAEKLRDFVQAERVKALHEPPPAPPVPLMPPPPPPARPPPPPFKRKSYRTAGNMDSTLNQLRATLLNRLGTDDGSTDSPRKAIDEIFEQLNTKKNARGKPTPPSPSIPRPTAAEPTAAKLTAAKLAAAKLAAAKPASAKPAAANGGFKLSKPAPAPPPPLSYLRQRAGYAGDPKERRVKMVKRAEEMAKVRTDRSEL